MDQNYAFTYVIGYRHKIDRIQNLRRVLDWINGFGGVEVLLIEQDTHSKISHLNLKAKHIFVKSNMPYNRSWAFNVALKNSNSNIMVFGDSDLIMEPNEFITGLNALKEYSMVSPYNSVIDLTPQETGMQLNEMLTINRPGRGETDIQKINICGGISMFRKEDIVRIGGFCELYIGWGCEDNDLSNMVEKFLTWTELKAKCYHLHHERPQPDITLYQRNLRLLDSRLKMDRDQLSKYAQINITKIGMKNKYNTF